MYIVDKNQMYVLLLTLLIASRCTNLFNNLFVKNGDKKPNYLHSTSSKLPIVP